MKETLQVVAPNTKATLVIRTQVKLNKKDVETKSIPNPYSEIYKTSTVEAILNPQYEEMVNQQREAEGKEADFTAEKAKWGTHIGGSLVEHNGVIYVTYVEEKSTVSSYEDQDGNLVEKEDFVAFQPKPSKSSTQNLENEVKYRKVKLENIKQVTIM